MEFCFLINEHHLRRVLEEVALREVDPDQVMDYLFLYCERHYFDADEETGEVVKISDEEALQKYDQQDL